VTPPLAQAIAVCASAGLPTKDSPMHNAVHLQVSHWFNAEQDFNLAALRGKIVVLHTFQLLCPGCVVEALPQIKRLEALAIDGLAIVGLHTVFEHHSAMGPEVLAAFLHEYRIFHPVGVDAHRPGIALPVTMEALGLRGTPSLLLLDRQGRERQRFFGSIADLRLGFLVAALLGESSGTLISDAAPPTARPCIDGPCVMDNVT